MAWKCVCKEENNDNNQKECINCGRKKPKYLGVKLDLDYDGPMPDSIKEVWLLKVANSYIDESDNYLKLITELLDEYGEAARTLELTKAKFELFKNRAGDRCNKALQLLKQLVSMSPDAQYESDDGAVHTINTIKSTAYFNIGLLHYKLKTYGKAIEYFQGSFDIDPNQVSIYNIAMATINLPIEGAGGLFGKKQNKEIAQTNKRDQEIELLKKTIKFYPFSRLAIDSGKMLINKYKISEFNI